MSLGMAGVQCAAGASLPRAPFARSFTSCAHAGWFACGERAPGTPPRTASGQTSGIDLTALDRSKQPGDDFFTYVNGAWVNSTAIPPDRSRWGAFDVLNEEATR